MFEKVRTSNLLKHLTSNFIKSTYNLSVGDYMCFLFNFVKGIFIGLGAILPGISSGVICMVVGLYEKLLDSALNFFKDIKTNLKFLLPILSGSITGIILFSKIILYCFNTIPCQTKSLFIGLLLGSIYILIKSNSKNYISNNKSNKISFLICFLIGLGLIYLENFMNIGTTNTFNGFNGLFLILSGFLMSIGIIVPGVSSTIILMLLGVYNTYLNSLSTLNINILFPMAIGIGIGSFIFMKIIQILLNKYHSQTMFGIIGFSLGSVLILFPGYSFNLESIIGLILLYLGFVIGKSIK